MLLSIISSLAAFCCVFLLIQVLGTEWQRSAFMVWRRFRKRWSLDEDPQPSERMAEGLELLEHSPTFVPLLRPSTDLQRRQIKLGLARAGFNHPHAVAWYVSLRLYLAGFGFLLGAGLTLGFGGWSMQNPAMGLLGAGLGYLGPEAALRWLQKRRRERLRTGLPDALDLMAMSIACGNGIEAALRDTTRELQDVCPMLAAQFMLYFTQLDLGTDRRVALQDLALRSGCSEMTSLTNLLIQSHATGCSVAQPLQRLSRDLRIQRRHRAEERASTIAVKITIPLVLFIFPGIFVVLVGPAAISVVRDVLALQ